MSLLYYKLNYIITSSIITILLIKILKVTVVVNNLPQSIREIIGRARFKSRFVGPQNSLS